LPVLLLLVPALVSGCSISQNDDGQGIAGFKSSRSYTYPLRERVCLERAMFFEANRKSRDGLIAVGTVVMNRVHSSQYPDTICSVVGQKNQFAPGVLTRPVNLKTLPDVQAAADAVLMGERHPKLKNAMFFHTAGLSFPYNNMHYVLVAGGNAFYEKRHHDGSLSVPVNDQLYNVAYAFAQENTGLAPAFARLTGTAQLVSGNGMVAPFNMLHNIPVPQLKAEEDATVVFGYTMPAARKADQIGALLLAQRSGKL